MSGKISIFSPKFAVDVFTNSTTVPAVLLDFNVGTEEISIFQNLTVQLKNIYLTFNRK